jgi:hypothetical protein
MDNGTPSEQKVQAYYARKHRDGVATRLKRIEASVENLRAAMQCVLAKLRSAEQGEQGQRR